MTVELPELLLIGANHTSANLAVREALSLSNDQVDALYRRMGETNGISGVVILNTCNRIEIYASITRGAHQCLREVESHLSAVTNYPATALREVRYTVSDMEVIRHLFSVAAGLNSQMVGETEILGQVKLAYQQAQTLKRLDKTLHQVFQKTFQAAKWVRTHTGISEGQISIGNVAVELAQRIYGDLKKGRALVVGSGEVGRDVAKAFARRGVRSMGISGRTPERTEALAAETGGSVIPFGEWPSHLSEWDIIICATSARQPVISCADATHALQARPARPLFFIDLAVPRDVDPQVGELTNAYLYNFADLAAIANENLKQRKVAVETCQRVLGERAANLWDTLSPKASRNATEADLRSKGALPLPPPTRS